MSEQSREKDAEREVCGTALIAAIKIAREKRSGLKVATIRMEWAAETWRWTHDLTLRRAIAHMNENRGAMKLKLECYMGAMGLSFSLPEEPEVPQERFLPVDLANFTLERESDDREAVWLGCEFMVPLAAAQRRLVSQIGEELLCTVTKSQMSLLLK